MNRCPASLSLLWAAIALLSSARADVLVSTDFTGRTVSGLTVSDIVWTTLGVNDPGALTVIEDEVPGIFDTPNSQGHFAPDRNVGNEGPWSVDVPLVLADGVGSITLESVELDWQHFNNSGVFQGPSRSVNWTVTVTGSVSGLLDGSTVVAPNINGVSGVETLTFPAPLILSSAETYRLNINASSSNTIGNNTGLDGIVINGTVGASTGVGFAITDINLDGSLLTLTWTSREGERYAVKYSPDMKNWDSDLDDGIDADAGERTTETFDLDLVGLGDAARVFFRVERQP